MACEVEVDLEGKSSVDEIEVGVVGVIRGTQQMLGLGWIGLDWLMLLQAWI